MKIEWLFEAQNEYRDFLLYYRTKLGEPYARKFAEKILSSVQQLERFPELGLLRKETLLGKHDFRALFIDRYVCIYRIEDDIVWVYALKDARTNYLYRIFGLE